MMRSVDGLSRRYRSVALTVDRVPRTATELYRMWAGLEERKSLTTRLRNERRWFAGVLVTLAKEHVIVREVSPENGPPYFWRD